MIQFLLEKPFLPLVFLFGSLVLTTANTALIRLGKFRAKELIRSSHPPILFFRPLLHRLFPKQEWENLYFSISISKHIYQLAYAMSSFFYVLFALPFFHQALVDVPLIHKWGPILIIAGILIFLSLFLDFVVRILASLWSKSLLRIAAPFASIYLTLLFPIIAILLHITRVCIHKMQIEEEIPTDKAKLREMIRESELQQHLDPGDQKLISSFVNFKERVAKEIMVPRVDVFSLSSDTTLREASRLFSQEGYSRIPIYRETLDQILGVVLYKDLLKHYASPGQNLDAALDTIAKPILYAPENKKIAQLLQEFRKSQIHMAIIVDEYGGTEGVVTIEDILEELVGEIEDEYDIEEHSFWELPDGGWIIDAKMTILNLEERLGLKIPHNPEYETIGGYVYHCAGTIPNKGWRLSHDEFDLEIISSNERGIKKIKIQPRQKDI